MKKALFGIVACTMVLVSCKKENNDTNETDPIIGNWQMVTRTTDGQLDLPNCMDSLFYIYEDGTAKYPNSSSNGGECSYSYQTHAWEKTGDNAYLISGLPTTTEFWANNDSMKQTVTLTVGSNVGKPRTTTYARK